MGATGTGDDAETGLRKTDCGVGGEDAEVGGEGEFEAAAEGYGGDGGHGGDGKVGEGVEGAAEVGEEVGSAAIELGCVIEGVIGNLLLLRKAPALLEVGAGAEASINGAGENESSRGTLLVDTSSAAKALHGRKLLAIGTILAVNSIDFVAQRSEESL